TRFSRDWSSDVCSSDLCDTPSQSRGRGVRNAFADGVPRRATMSSSNEHAVYRITKRRRTGDVPKGYRHTWVVTDDATGESVAQCDLTGRAVFSTLERSE